MKINRKLVTLATTAAIALGGLSIAPSATAAETPAPRAWCSYTLNAPSSGDWVSVSNVVCTGGRQVAPVIRYRGPGGYNNRVGAFVSSGSSRVDRPAGTIGIRGWAIVD